MNDDKNTCQNCSYYCKYYFICGVRIKSAGRGYCVNAKTHYRKRQRKAGEVCDLFEPAEVKPTEQKERIENTLREMSKNLKQILLILKTE